MRMIKGLENTFLIQLNENSLQEIVQSSQTPNKLPIIFCVNTATEDLLTQFSNMIY